MEIQAWPIERLKPYANNPRIICDEAIEKVARSIKAYGFKQPIVVDQGGVIVVGHTRFAAAKSLGLCEVPVHVTELDAKMVREYRLADNRVGQDSEWDRGRLALEIVHLDRLEHDLYALGFDQEELQELDWLLQDGNYPGGEDATFDIPGKSNVAVGMSGHDKESDMVSFRVSRFRFEMNKVDFEVWMADLMAEVGDDEKAICDEIRSRLGMNDEG